MDNFIKEEELKMLLLNKLKVKGFRGFLKEEEFIFDTPVIFFLGRKSLWKKQHIKCY